MASAKKKAKKAGTSILSWRQQKCLFLNIEWESRLQCSSTFSSWSTWSEMIRKVSENWILKISKAKFTEFEDCGKCLIRKVIFQQTRNNQTIISYYLFVKWDISDDFSNTVRFDDIVGRLLLLLQLQMSVSWKVRTFWLFSSPNFFFLSGLSRAATAASTAIKWDLKLLFLAF